MVDSSADSIGSGAGHFIAARPLQPKPRCVYVRREPSVVLPLRALP